MQTAPYFPNPENKRHVPYEIVFNGTVIHTVYAPPGLNKQDFLKYFTIHVTFQQVS